MNERKYVVMSSTPGNPNVFYEVQFPARTHDEWVEVVTRAIYEHSEISRFEAEWIARCVLITLGVTDDDPSSE